MGISSPQKHTTLSTLCTIPSNILDPAKTDPKFSRLKLSNPTLQKRLFSYDAMMQLLQLIGFTHKHVDDGDECLVFTGLTDKIQICRDEVKDSLKMFTPSTVSNNSIITSKLTQKAKARMLLEEKQKEEKLRD